MAKVFIDGMHGLGDNLYQRAIMREFCRRNDEVWLRTSWPTLYHDMPKVRCVTGQIHLRTQRANQIRQKDLFHNIPKDIEKLQHIRNHYPMGVVLSLGGLPQAMAHSCGLKGMKEFDYRLPVPPEWQEAARALVGYPDKPIMALRPLTVRTEWRPSSLRNADERAYYDILASIRDQFFVVSCADLQHSQEWLVGTHMKADLEFHKGMPIETLIGLFSISQLAFATAGFGLAMAQATETPTCLIFGGMESSRAHRNAAVWAPFLGIDPEKPCDCWNSQHACNKQINIPLAASKVKEFVQMNKAFRVPTVRVSQKKTPLQTIKHSDLVGTMRPINWRPKMGFYPYFNRGEPEAFLALIELYANQPEVMIEFGCNEGRTAALVIDRFRHLKRYIGIDVAPSYSQELLPIQRKEIPAQPGNLVKNDRQFELIVRKRGSLDITFGELPNADVIFIDGDHRWATVARDSVLAREAIKPGGLIIWHDYHQKGTVDVSAVLEEMVEQEGRNIVHLENTWFAFERF